MKRLRTWAAAAAMLALAGAAQASLVSRGGGMIYDTTLNLTWLADMNYAQTTSYTGSGVNVDGSMTWDAANLWANSLVYGGYSDWRLPTLSTSNPNPSCPYGGDNCTGGELSHLFVTDLGYNSIGGAATIKSDDTVEQRANLALFSNVQPWYYWSGTAYAPAPSYAWYFATYNGNQSYHEKWATLSAVAVRSGDVAAAVPEPQTWAMLLAGLGAVLLAAKRRPA